jgi:hypothetical protein
MKKLLGNKVTLGAEASVAAGPVGRDARAATDAQMNAEILSYSRTQDSSPASTCRAASSSRTATTTKRPTARRSRRR